ncbi:MAG: helicase-associated domain-containing protein [Spirochaetaceae bacterium]|jgi:hypothetical protein|nr:helicase-associated domain-containing protein [Spirochaetaceae bacterium]
MNKKSPSAWRFRSQDEWKSCLLTLPDTACFDLLRSVFGNIKTPFNKQQLMEKLTAFLSRKEIQDTIAAYINTDDHRIIAAVTLLGEPSPAELENFFAGEYSCAEFHSLLLNLEERLILYRLREEGNYRISLNPLLEPVLSPFIADRSVLFPSFPGGEDAGQAAARQPLDDRVFAAIIAFVAAQGEAQKDFFKTDGGIRKKIVDDSRQIFPNLDIWPVVEGLRSIGLLETDGISLAPEKKKLVSFGRLNFRERLEYLAAGIYAAPQSPETDNWYFRRGYIRNLARFIHRFISTFDCGRLYPRRTLLRFAEIQEKNNSGALFRNEGGPPPAPDLVAGETGRFLSVLETAGLLRAAGENSGEAVYALEDLPDEDVFPDAPFAPESRSGAQQPPEQPVIAMDTPFSCILYPGIDFSDAATLASFCDCRETGATVRFELTRDSVVRGFDRGLRAEEMIGVLERLSLGAPDQNLAWTVKDWENRYSAVSLFQGTVLTLSEDRRYLAETGMLSSLICRTLAPGVYLLALAGKDEAARILQKAGVDIIAQPPLILPDENSYSALAYSPYPSVGSFGVSVPGAGDRGEGGPACPPEDREERAKAAEERKGKLREALRKSGLPKPDQDDLAARIDRRQIVSESQLTGGVARHEKIEARNLDYVGKTVVAKQAIASGSLVEVLLPSAEGGGKRILGTPQALEKSGGETVLLLRPLARGGPGKEKQEDEMRIPLGKISLLRWIKQSIFTG